MLEYDPDTHVAVPKDELAKLEQSRVALYEYLEEKKALESTWDLVKVNEITRQIWTVANRIKWGN